MRFVRLFTSLSPVMGAALLMTSCTAVDNVVFFMEKLVHNVDTPQFQRPSSGDFSATEDEAFTLTLNASDEDLEYGDKLVFSAAKLPQWLYLSRSGLLEGTPKNEDVGIHALQLRVTDLAGQYDELNIDIKVENTNDGPKIISQRLEDATQGEAYEQLISVHDDDLIYGDRLGYELRENPQWLGISSAGVLNGTPENADVGIHKFIILVSDRGGLSAQQHFVVEVKNVNDAPKFEMK